MALPFFLTVVCIFVSLAVLLYTSRQRRRGVGQSRGQEQKLRLPPGSMGWPYVGETLQLYSQDPNVFFASKQKRYGEIFKTHLLGCPCVMLASPEAARFVLVTHAQLFKPTYPPSKERMIGPWALFFHQGEYHLRLRRLVQGSLGPDALRALVPGIEAAVASTLGAWDGHIASTFHAMKRLSFDVGLVTVFGGRLDQRYKEELRRNYSIVENGYNCFPNRFPGTLYYKAIQVREEAAACDPERGRGGAAGAGRPGRRPPGRPHALTRRQRRGAHGRPDRRQRHRRAVRGAGHHGQRAHLDPQVPPRLPEASRGRQGGANGGIRGERRREAAADVDADEENDTNAQGHIGELEDGKHHLLHVQGGRCRRGVQRLPDSQGVEGDASVSEHPSQPGVLPRSTQVRSFKIQGGAAAQHVPAVRQRRARVPRERAGQARDARPRAPPRHRLQVGLGDRWVGRPGGVQPVPCAEARSPRQAVEGVDQRRGKPRPNCVRLTGTVGVLVNKSINCSIIEIIVSLCSKANEHSSRSLQFGSPLSPHALVLQKLFVSWTWQL